MFIKVPKNRENEEKPGKFPSLRRYIYLTIASGIPWFLTMASGIISGKKPFVVVLEIISYALYGTCGAIQRIIKIPKIDQNIESFGKFADKLYVVIRRLDIYFTIPFESGVLVQGIIWS